MLLGFVLVLTVIATFLFYQSTVGVPAEETQFSDYTSQTQTPTTPGEQTQTPATKPQPQTSTTQQQTKSPTTEKYTQTQPPAQTTKSVVTVKQYTFRTAQLLESHYQKHGDEFGNITKEDYLRGANNLIRSGNPNLLTKFDKEDGDKLYYLESSNEFLVLSVDGYIRTYFKPDNGISYFNKQ